MDNSSFVQYDIFEPFNNLLTFTSLKQTLNHAAPRFTGDTAAVFQNNRKQLAHLLGIKKNQLVFPRQTHTSCVAELSTIPSNELNETDGLVTAIPGICLCIQTADCVPVLLFDPVTNVIGAAHAGWRGTVKRIPSAAVYKMKNNYGSSPKNIMALIGPSIGPAVYEVGEEVILAARKNIPNPENTIQSNQVGKNHFNLWEANRQVLLSSGLLHKNIRVFGECSFQNHKKYFSARREGTETGRNVSGIMLL